MSRRKLRVVPKRHRRKDFRIKPKRHAGRGFRIHMPRKRSRLSSLLSRYEHRLIPIAAIILIIGLATDGRPLAALRSLGLDLSFIDTSWLQIADQTVDGKVTRVIDGDTIEVRGLGRIRLHEIDTPEKGQPYGRAARSALAKKIAGKQVRVEVFDTDRYGRKVSKIWLGERDINREMVRDGYAWVYRQHMRDGSLLADERAAREVGVGLWADKQEPVPPWEWRRRQ